MEVEWGEGRRGRARGHVLWGRGERGRVWAQVCGVASVVRIRAGGCPCVGGRLGSIAFKS